MQLVAAKTTVGNQTSGNVLQAKTSECFVNDKFNSNVRPGTNVRLSTEVAFFSLCVSLSLFSVAKFQFGTAVL